MSFIVATALAASMAAIPVCSWNEPGHNRYSGSMAAAVDRYADIPADVRGRLKQRMARHQYDEMATIRRDSITGRATYAPEIRDMHFGAGQVCGTVDRKRWRDDQVERGLVYCEGEHCLIVPTVCRNVSRITRVAPAAGTQAGAGTGTGGAAPAQQQAAATPGAAQPAPEGELVFDAPGAGPADAAAAGGADDGRAARLGDTREGGPSFQDIVAGNAIGAPVVGAPVAGASTAGASTAGPTGLGGDTPPTANPAPPSGAEFGSLAPPTNPSGNSGIGNPGGTGGTGNPGGTVLPTFPQDFRGYGTPTSTPALTPALPLSPVPEPATGVLALAGLAGLAAWRRWGRPGAGFTPRGDMPRS